MSGKLIVLSAPSGGGKTTLCKRLLAETSELVLSISSTTRAPRGQEKHGQEYFFLDRATFERGVADGKFAEWATVHGNLYGTSRQVIDEAFARGKSVLLDIDVQGAAQLKASYPSVSFSIFISPPDLATLEARLRGRGTETEEAIQRRLRNAAEEMAQKPLFDRVIINDELQRAYDELRRIVRNQVAGAGGTP